jgi:hypothetical protein
LASKQGTHYKTLLTQLETILAEELERSFFPQMAKYCAYDWHLTPDLYNLMNGISGCLAYLSLRKDEVWLNKLALRCLEELVRGLSRQRIVLEKQLPGWYVEPNNPNIQGEFPHGLFDLSTSFGISGVLATLSLAAQNDLVVSGQLDLMHQIAYWLKDQQKISASGIVWEPYSPVEKGSSAGISRDIWDYGAPSVARSLHLASTILKDPPLGQFAQDCFEKIFQKPAIDWNLIATPLTHGRAGLLTITDRMAKDTGSLFLKQQVYNLEQDLLRFYDPDHRYCFRMAAFDERLEDSYRWVDSPFFLDGSAGVALSLLSLSSYRVLDWQRALLIC